jgi:hypothetical protein
MVRVVVKEKEGYNEIAFQFPAVVSAGAFMECLATSAEKDIFFEVTFEKEKSFSEIASRFINPEEEE